MKICSTGRIPLSKVPGVYIVTNTDTGVFYVGSTANLGLRRAQHAHHLTHGTHSNDTLQNVFNEHPEGVYNVLITPDRETAFSIEQEILDICQGLPTLANKATDARLPTKGKILTEEEKQLRVISSTGRKLSDEAKAKISVANSGKTKPWLAERNRARSGQPLSEEHRAKLSAVSKGVPKTQEHRDRIGAAQKGVSKPPEHVAKMVETRWGQKQSND